MLDVAFIFGSIASGKQHADSDIDICVLGDIALIDVVKALSSIKYDVRREVNPVAMRAAEFREQLGREDRFAERVADESKVFVIGNERESGKLIEGRAT